MLGIQQQVPFDPCQRKYSSRHAQPSDLQTCWTSVVGRVYEVRKVLHLTMTSEGEGTRTVAAKILELRQPFTLSCVMIVEADAGADLESMALSSKAVLKLHVYDRQCASQLRKDEEASEWTSRQKSNSSRRTAPARRLCVSKSSVRKTCTIWALIFPSPKLVHMTFRNTQGKSIPQLYSMVTLPVDAGSQTVPTEVEAQEFLTIPGILMEHVVSPTMLIMANLIPKQS